MDAIDLVWHGVADRLQKREDVRSVAVVETDAISYWGQRRCVLNLLPLILIRSCLASRALLQLFQFGEAAIDLFGLL